MDEIDQTLERARKEERTMKLIAAMAAVFGLAGAPALAAASSEPVELADHELDQVTAGDGSLLHLNLDLDVRLKNIFVTVNVSNVPINAAVVVQANALGQAIQDASVTAGQSVTQMQAFGTPLALH
jgi:hypothetical protein